MTAIEDPIEYDITVRSDTDHEWKFRRKNSLDEPIIPSSAKAEIRSEANRELWQELTCTISEDGWISVTLDRISADDKLWNKRKEGEWDLLVTYADKVYRWVEGKAIIDIGVTLYG